MQISRNTGKRASQIAVGAGKVLQVTFDIDASYGMPLAATIVVLYTMMGGFSAVCYTDVVQALLMIITLVAMPVIGFIYISSHGLEVVQAMEASARTGRPVDL